MPAPLTVTYWAIAYRDRSRAGGGIYIGTWLTRRAAKEAHAKDWGQTWAQRRAVGDRAIKVRVTETTERV